MFLKEESGSSQHETQKVMLLLPTSNSENLTHFANWKKVFGKKYSKTRKKEIYHISL